MATQENSKKKTDKLPRRVLIVEDDAIIGFALEQALLEGGVAEVDLCASTDDALAALRNGKPGAIILDVHLADSDDGWAVAELVRTLGPDAPRIVFSTGAPDDIPEEIAEMGCVMVKPYDPGELVELLKQPRRKGIISRLRGALREDQ